MSLMIIRRNRYPCAWEKGLGAKRDGIIREGKSLRNQGKPGSVDCVGLMPSRFQKDIKNNFLHLSGK